MKTVLSSEELAKNVCTNPVLIRKVMSKLKKAGFVDTKGGNNGGYVFAADAETLRWSRLPKRLTCISLAHRGKAAILIRSV